MTSLDIPERPAHYSMLIQWSDEDDAYIVTVLELPGCMTHGATYAEAVRQGEDAIATWIDTAQAWGDPIRPQRVFGAPSDVAG